MEIIRIIITGFIGGIFHLDNVQVGQFFISRASFIGVLIGFLNGCPLEGAIMGILIELIYSDFLPLGEAVPPNGLVASSIAVLLYAYAFQSMSLAFFIAVFAGVFYAKVEFILRKKRSSWNTQMEGEINESRLKINHWIAKALVMESLVAAIFIMGFPLILKVMGFFCNYERVYSITDLAFSLVPWIILTSLILKFRRQVIKQGKKAQSK